MGVGSVNTVNNWRNNKETHGLLWVWEKGLLVGWLVGTFLAETP